MAKCSICNSRKGKRFCRISETYICSLCCGESRVAETCIGCNFYQEPKPPKLQGYTDFPMFSIQRMDGDLELQRYSNAVESAICAFDQSEKLQLTDKTALRILELLLDKYHAKKDTFLIDDKPTEKGFNMVGSMIQNDLPEISDEIIARIVGTIYFVAKRRSKGNREYLDFIHGYVGTRVADGIRLIPNPLT